MAVHFRLLHCTPDRRPPRDHTHSPPHYRPGAAIPYAEVSWWCFLAPTVCCYAMSGTELPYAAISARDARY
eukprot:3295935-Rhodomonas_salina.1